MPRYKNGTPTIEARILAALRFAHRQGTDSLTVAELHRCQGLISRRSSDITAAAERLVDAGDLVLGWRMVPWAGARWTYRLWSPPDPLGYLARGSFAFAEAVSQE